MVEERDDTNNAIPVFIGIGQQFGGAIRTPMVVHQQSTHQTRLGICAGQNKRGRGRTSNGKATESTTATSRRFCEGIARSGRSSHCSERDRIASGGGMWEWNGEQSTQPPIHHSFWIVVFAVMLFCCLTPTNDGFLLRILIRCVSLSFC